MTRLKAVLYSILSLYGLGDHAQTRRRRPPIQIGRPYPGR